MMDNLTPTVKTLLMINIGLFILKITGFDDSFLHLHYFEAESFKIFQPITYMFIHAGTQHIFMNMFGLFMFGPLLEKIWGQNRFLIFYFVCGVGSGLLYNLIQYFEYAELRKITESCLADPTLSNLKEYQRYFGIELIQINATITTDLVKEFYQSRVNLGSLVGASGAIFGLLTAYGMLFPNSEMMIFPIPIPIKAKYFVILYGAYEFWSGVKNAPGDNVAHFGHIGGMIFAFILIKYWGSQRNKFY
ncbi:MAG: rhomboid family intramembrane serine protease [Pseudarcicella sp.]|nr:rhomboid family intramembrane serine protease [Pseudarcicella sp.]